MKKILSPASFGPPEFVGTTVIGERGQVVIPKDVRDEHGLDPGSKLVVLRHGKNGPIILIPFDQMQKVMEEMAERFSFMQNILNK